MRTVPSSSSRRPDPHARSRDDYPVFGHVVSGRDVSVEISRDPVEAVARAVVAANR